MQIEEYYKNEAVRRRILEFLGGRSIEEATGVHLSRCDELMDSRIDFKSIRELDFFLNNGLDVGRSLWDREFLIAHLDIEYVNFDSPAEAYFHPVRAFAIQQPLMLAVQKILLEYGISPLHLLSGRGHHFVWQFRRDGEAFQQLAKIGRVPPYLVKYYAEPHPPANLPIEPELGAAFAGLGLVMEYLAQRVQQEAAPVCEIPIRLTDVVAKRNEHGREIIDLDITEYGDPLNTRMMRIPFSVYLKPWEKEGFLDDAMKEKIPYMFSIPLHEMDVSQGVQVMRDSHEVAQLAERASAQIPDQSTSMAGLIHAYSESELAKFHDEFYSQEHEPPHLWPSTYDQTPLDSLPPCVRHILQNPNPLLLKPTGIRQVVRVMLALGWHPRHIAGLIRSKYERDYGWGELWYTYDAGMRADFYTRVFAGAIAMGLDDLSDFDCYSTKEEEFCFQLEHHCNLEEFRNLLRERMKHE